ncbi:unnamed protein product [Symbiodinium sp. CCMP2592]|nr:unnamed protein product [Symbiodinium sp. CCMP2592]
MASDHNPLGDWLKTLSQDELEKLRAMHSASAQAAADTEDLEEAATAQPSQPSASAGDADTAAVTELPIEAEEEYMPMEEPFSSTAFHAEPQEGLYSMMGELIAVPSIVIAATHTSSLCHCFSLTLKPQPKPINLHELWQLIKRPDLGVARESGAYLTADRFAVSPPASFFPSFPNAPINREADTSPMPHAKAEPPPVKAVPTGAVPPPTKQPPASKPSQPTKERPQQKRPCEVLQNWKPPAEQNFLPDAAKAQPSEPKTKAMQRCSTHRVFFEPEFLAAEHKTKYSGPYRPAKPFGLAVIYDCRTWINFYGVDSQDQPTDEVEFEQPLPLLEWFSADTGVLRYWRQDPRRLPEALVDRRKQLTIEPPADPYLYKPPAMALPRLPCSNMRNCIMLPSLTLPHTYELDPAFARVYYMGSRGELRCGLPCSTVPFCPFHSACGRELNRNSVEHDDKHSGHQCSRCKEFTDLGRSPFEWFSAVPPQASTG